MNVNTKICEHTTQHNVTNTSCVCDQNLLVVGAHGAQHLHHRAVQRLVRRGAVDVGDDAHRVVHPAEPDQRVLRSRQQLLVFASVTALISKGRLL